jgi:hypothetical protein
LKHIAKALSWIFLKIAHVTKMLPGSIAGIFIVITFFYNLFTTGFSYAFAVMAKAIFSAELVINENVHLAIQNSPSYNIVSFFNIVVSFLVIYTLAKFIKNLLMNYAGATASGSAFIIAILIIAIIQISAIAVIDGTFGFIPIKDGVIFLLMNLEPVFTNIFSQGVVVIT